MLELNIIFPSPLKLNKRLVTQCMFEVKKGFETLFGSRLSC